MSFHHAAKRVRDQKPSVWEEFTNEAKLYARANIGQGFSDEPAPKFVTDCMKNVALHPELASYHQYTRSSGHMRLAHAIVNFYSEVLNKSIVAITDVLITAGAYAALSYSFSAWLNPGDEVIIFEPAFDAYISQIKLAGGVPVPILLELALDAETSAAYSFDPRLLEKKVTKKTKMIVVNNPHNPTGKLFSCGELLLVAEVAARHNLIVVSDEVYEWHVYGPGEMVHFASLPEMYKRTITIGSAGKGYSVTGWKVGWAMAPDHLLKPLRAIHQNFVYNCSTPAQEAIAQAFEQDLDNYYKDKERCYLTNGLTKNLRNKRDHMAALLRMVGMKPIIPDAGYFMMVDFTSLGEDYKKADYNKEEDKDEPNDVKFARWLCREKNLAVIPPSAFYSDQYKKNHQNMVRVCFFKSYKTFDKVEEILREYKRSLDASSGVVEADIPSLVS